MSSGFQEVLQRHTKDKFEKLKQLHELESKEFASTKRELEERLLASDKLFADRQEALRALREGIRMLQTENQHAARQAHSIEAAMAELEREERGEIEQLERKVDQQKAELTLRTAEGLAQVAAIRASCEMRHAERSRALNAQLEEMYERKRALLQKHSLLQDEVVKSRSLLVHKKLNGLQQAEELEDRARREVSEEFQNDLTGLESKALSLEASLDQIVATRTQNLDHYRLKTQTLNEKLVDSIEAVLQSNIESDAKKVCALREILQTEVIESRKLSQAYAAQRTERDNCFLQISLDSTADSKREETESLNRLKQVMLDRFNSTAIAKRRKLAELEIRVQQETNNLLQLQAEDIRLADILVHAVSRELNLASNVL